MSVYDWAAGLWRTVVPVIAGTLVTWLAHIYVTIDTTKMSAFLITAFTALYYGLFRWLELRASKQWGWLLGLARPAHYERPTITSQLKTVKSPPIPPSV